MSVKHVEAIFISLDIFKKSLHNNGIRSKLDAWLAFLCVDDPEWIIEILRRYPEFQAMYEHAYDICLNVEKVMEMFSKELAELDRNTTLYMIDELQNELDNTRAALEESQKRNAELEAMKAALEESHRRNAELEAMKAALEESQKRNAELEQQLKSLSK